MPTTQAETIGFGKICPDCPSKELGPLALGQSCSGKKTVGFGRNEIDYCGRITRQKTAAEKIMELMKKHYPDD